MTDERTAALEVEYAEAHRLYMIALDEATAREIWALDASKRGDAAEAERLNKASHNFYRLVDHYSNLCQKYRLILRDEP